MTAGSIRDQDLERFLADERFSRVFEYPANPARGCPKALRISYADYGYRNTEHPHLEKVFVFFGPLLGSRMIYVSKDALAKEHGVRIINADRPGFGETPDVEAEERLAFWREAMPALLQYLEIRHVFVGAQSGGTVYALDFILHHPQMLHPEHAYLAIGAPWVHPCHSQVWQMSLTHALPKFLLGQADKLASLFSTVSAPILDTGSGLTSALGRWFGAQPSDEQDVAAADAAVAFAEALDPKLVDFIYSRPVNGISNEAILLMQRTQGTIGWASWGDYDTLVPRLRRTLAENDRRLVVECFLSEADSTIGNPGAVGPEWFKGCWSGGGGGQGDDDDAVQFSSRVIHGADHDSIWATRWGVARDVFGRIGRTRS